jgi:hypothetical protein
MASITQTIPNFFGGISKVPDSQMGQGQVKDALNCIPDLNKGLYKRPGAMRVGTAPLSGATSTGVWFHYYRDETEGSYIGQVQTDGSVNMWDGDTGNAITVNYESGQQTNLQNYLSNGTIGSETLQFTTINDSTFVVNRNVTAAMEATSVSKTDERPHTYSAFIELKRTQNGRQYGINIHNPTSNTTTSISTATQASANPTGEGYSTFSGNQGHCPFVGTKVFTLNSGSKTNLVFRLTVTGQQGPVPNHTDESPEAGDYTCTYSHRLDLLHGGEGWTVGSAGSVTLEGKSYPINVDKIETVSVRASIKAVRPDPTPFDQQTNVTPDSILGGITAELSGTGISHEVIGNGIYFYSNTTNFTVEAQNTDLMSVITDQVNDVTGLPFQCKHGYIVKVSNSSSADDDYYLRFEGNGGGSGPGSWVECAEPGIADTINPLTVPIVIQRQSNGQFIVKRFSYSQRTVGDLNTNPEPSFIGKKINKVLFFRNRLAFLSDENVILSQPGDLGNFFVNTALTVSGTDPIDISCSSKYPAILFDALEVNTGLIVFAENQQFLLATDSDILNPDTARLSSISTYNYNTDVPPFSLGTVAGFLDNAGAHTRFFVMSNVAREGEPNVNELSKVVSTALSKDIDLLADSRENTTIFFGKKSSDEVFGYKYFNVADRQVQSSWFRWKHTRPIVYHCCVNDTYIFVDDQNFLQKINLIRDDDSTFTENSEEYVVHLDNYVAATGGSYDSATRQTTFTLSWLSSITDKSVDLVAVKPGADGLIVLNVDVPSSGTTVTVPGNEPALTFGYAYTMQVDFPRFYVQKVVGERTINEERGSLIVHRIKPSFGRLGQYETVVTRVGKTDYTDEFTSSTFNQYLVADVQVEDEYIGTVPVYEKNNNFNLSIKSTTPLPATLISLTWEGDYSPKYYKNV